MHQDFISSTGETADDIINQHLIEEEQSLRSNHMESKYKDLVSPGKKNKNQDEIGDDLYEDDPEFEKIANNNSDEKEKDGEKDNDSYGYIDDSLNFNQKSPK